MLQYYVIPVIIIITIIIIIIIIIVVVIIVIIQLRVCNFTFSTKISKLLGFVLMSCSEVRLQCYRCMVLNVIYERLTGSQCKKTKLKTSRGHTNGMRYA
jgi:hypothetical protein